MSMEIYKRVIKEHPVFKVGAILRASGLESGYYLLNPIWFRDDLNEEMANYFMTSGFTWRTIVCAPDFFETVYKIDTADGPQYVTKKIAEAEAAKQYRDK